MLDLDKTPWGCLGVKGIVGASLLRHGAVEIDGGLRQLRFAASASDLEGARLGGGTPMRWDALTFTPLVEIDLVATDRNVRAKVWTRVDTGNMWSALNVSVSSQNAVLVRVTEGGLR